MAEQEHLETCANCGRTIGSSAMPMVWQEKVVCPECRSRLEQNPPNEELASPPPAASAEGIAGPPEPLQCPESWKYTREWENDYEKTHEHLSKRCGHSGAQFRILYYIRGHGEEALTKIKTQNLFITRIAAGTVNVAQIRDSDIDWQSGCTWAHLNEQWEELFAIYNAHLAPPDILEILEEVHAFMDAGRLHCQSLLRYLADAKVALVRKQKDEEKRRLSLRKRSLQQQPSLWDVIDRKHSQVPVGFVYLLSNDLMPGVYKIGFSEGNPDKRARDVSLKIGLPMPFEVIAYWRTKDPYIVEQRIHAALANCAKGGEFFQVDLELAKTTIESCILH